MYERIVVGTDGSETATRAVLAAAGVARAWDADLCIAAAYAPKLTADQRYRWHEVPEDVRWRLGAGVTAEAVVHDAARRAQRLGGRTLGVDTRCEPGRPAEVILQVADEVGAGMVIVGNRDMVGRRRIRRGIGHALARRAGCDVLVVDTVGAGAAACSASIRRPLFASP